MSQTPSWTLKLAGRNAAAGLTWIPLIGTTTRASRQEFQQHLRKHRSTHGVLFKSSKARYPLAGIVRPRKAGSSHATGKLPVSLWFAASVHEPTIFVGVAEGGFWILAADETGADPRGDVVVAARDVSGFISELLIGYQADGSVARIVVDPAAKDVIDSLESLAPLRVASLESILNKTPPKTTIYKAVGIPTWLTVSVGVALAMAGLAYAGVVVKEKFEQRQMQREAEQAKAEAEAKKAREAATLKAEMETQSGDLLANYTATPSPSSLVSSCVKAWTEMPARLGGWKRTSLECTGDGTISMAFSLEDSVGNRLATELSFREAANQYGLEAVVDWFNKTGTVRASFELAPGRQVLQAKDLPRVQDAGTALASLSQRVTRAVPGTSFNATKPVAESQGSKATGKDTPPPPPAFLVGKLSFSGSGLWLLREVAPDAENIRLDSIRMSQEATAVRWSAEGIFLTSTT